MNETCIAPSSECDDGRTCSLCEPRPFLPSTRAEIRAWLTAELSVPHLPEAQARVEVDGDVWVVERGFRRAFHCHSAVRLERPGELAFIVSNEFGSGFGGCAFSRVAALPRYSTLGALIEATSETYALLWDVRE